MKILTLCLNPAFDIHCALAHFDAERENFVQSRICDVGGKGINIARALRANDVDCTAYVLLGKENAAEFECLLQKEGITYRALYVEGRIRENLTLHPEGKAETRISFAGFSSDDFALSSLEEMLPPSLADTFVCLSGSIAEGIDVRAVKAFLARLRARGARVLLDSRSFTREDILEISPFFIKPNLDELSCYAQSPLKTEEEIVECALSLHQTGVACVMVTMGEKGALIVSEGACHWACVPKISVRSTVGAGDSAVAGFLSALKNGMDVPAALRLATAYGCAACLSEGTKPPQKTDIEMLLSRIHVRSFPIK